MLILFKDKIKFDNNESSSESQCTWGWYDASDKSTQIANKEQEIADQKLLVDGLRSVLDSISTYEGDIESISTDYTNMANRFDEVGQFGTDNIDADNLFSGSGKCISDLSLPLADLESQISADYTTEDEKLTKLQNERNDPHFGMVEDCR